MSKRTKTYQDKQREFTNSELIGLEHMRKKNTGVSTPDKILTPDELKLQDVKLGGENQEALWDKGKLITPEILAQEKAKLEEESKMFSKEFIRQIKEWIAEDHHSEYEGLEFDHDDYLVRLFKMDITMFSKFTTLAYEWSAPLRSFKLKDEPATENVFPIVKILKVGSGIKSSKYQVGDICLVPSSDVIGEDWNPKFLHVMQFQNSQNMKPVLPDGMRQSIPNVEKNWERYMFVRPWVPKPEPIDSLTYLIPETKVRGSYEF